eukprot:TRINITY_DN9271_c0_g1_i1.p1 TRINITY_DN9271_c0_g1~~TRINITY_DN9271_c0_g1_i1.p1  ORF type:complete len:640 (-),score=197.14 TRINITY_DN9271_c0_g1_i1:51-1970(-)
MSVPHSHEKQRKALIRQSTSLSLKSEAVRTGWIYKRGYRFSKAWRRRWAVLTNKELFYYKEDEKEKPARGYIGPLSDYNVVVAEGEKHTELHPKKESGRVWYIRFESDVEVWISLLEKVCSLPPSPSITPGRGTVMSMVRPQIQIIEERLEGQGICIPPEDLLIKDTEKLGSGASGMVQKGLWQNTTEVAVKTLIDLPEMMSEEDQDAFYREIEMLSQLRHPEIVTMYGFCKKGNQTCLVTEYVREGNLSEVIRDESINIPYSLVLDIAISIVRGMIFLHKKSIIHRDLKPANVLIVNLDEGVVKVCDFGLSKVVNVCSSQEEEPTFGTPQYAAPELPTARHNEKVDVYSFAFILWELICRKTAWSGIAEFGGDIANRVMAGQRLPIPEDCQLKEVIESCWATDPEERPSFETIHNTLTGMKASLPPDLTLGTLKNTFRTKNLTPEEKIKLKFQDGNLPWTAFATVLKEVLSADPEDIAQLKYVLVSGNNRVEIANWENLLGWFKPLNLENASIEATKPDGYKISEVANIVGKPWFYGFVSSQRATSALVNHFTDCFLIRFSSNAGFYTLSILSSKKAFHYRIGAEKNDHKITFKIESEEFESLDDIIKKYSETPLQHPGNANGILLGIPCDRNATMYS